jgi:heme-degrading monooxygenase HmoA
VSHQITAFEVPSGEDEEFLAAWDGERGAAGAVLFRALRSDVRLRFVEIGPADEKGEGRYEVVHEDGEPDGAEGVTLINLFEVAPADDERFRAAWDTTRDVLGAQRGYLGTRLHRATGDADFRFVNQARWSSPLMHHRATQLPEFKAAAGGLTFPSHPGLYQPVRG